MIGLVWIDDLCFGQLFPTPGCSCPTSRPTAPAKWVREFGGWEQAPDGQPLTTDFVDDLDIVLPNRAGKYATHLLVDPTVAMTAGRALEFPVGSNPVRMIVDNQTAQTITVKITGQTGVAVATATKKDLYFDGTDMVEFP